MGAIPDVPPLDIKFDFVFHGFLGCFLAHDFQRQDGSQYFWNTALGSNSRLHSAHFRRFMC